MCRKLVLYFSVYGTAKAVAEMIARQPDVFTTDHYVFYQKDGGYHDFNAVQGFLYNALSIFFGGASE